MYHLLIPTLDTSLMKIPVFSPAEVIGVRGGTCPPLESSKTNTSVKCLVTVNMDSKMVTSTSGVLVLGSYNPVKWIISNPKEIPISKIILLGYEEQEITGVSASTIIESHSYKTDKIYQSITKESKYHTEGSGVSLRFVIDVEPNQLSENFSSWLKTQGYQVAHFQAKEVGDFFNVIFEDSK